MCVHLKRFGANEHKHTQAQAREHKDNQTFCRADEHILVVFLSGDPNENSRSTSIDHIKWLNILVT